MGGFTVSVAASMTSHGAAPRRKLRLGGPIFLKSEDPAELARAHRGLGYSDGDQPGITTSKRRCYTARAFP